VHAYDDALGIDANYGVSATRPPGRVVVDVFDEALDRDVRNAADDVEVIAVNVAVEHSTHLLARLEQGTKLAPLLYESAVRSPPEPTGVVEILLARAVMHEHDRRELRPLEIALQPRELGLAHVNVATRLLDGMKHRDVEAAAIERVVERSGGTGRPCFPVAGALPSGE
jgi:hypothetical protein